MTRILFQYTNDICHEKFNYSGFLFLRSKISHFKAIFLISLPWLIGLGLLLGDR